MKKVDFKSLPNKTTPINAANLNKIQENAEKAIDERKSAIELLTVSDTAPSKCNIRNKYYNTTTSKIYTAIATNTWARTGENPSNLYLYVDLEHKELYYFNGTTFVSYSGGSGGTGGDTISIIQETGTASTTNVYSAKAIDNKLKTNITTGQEVATNEYLNGKRVYKRNISAKGENSSGTTLTLSNINFNFSEIWIDESNSFISNESETLSTNWYFAPEDYCRVWIAKNTKIIRYRTGGNLSGRTFNVMLKYTKNT